MDCGEVTSFGHGAEHRLDYHRRRGPFYQRVSAFGEEYIYALIGYLASLRECPSL